MERVRNSTSLDRRQVLGALAGGAAALLAPASIAAAPLTRTIPSSGEALPLVGLGTWITFNVGKDPVARDACTEVMRAFFAGGGRLIDCSPMYASSQPVIGYGLSKLKPSTLFAADKVWTSPARGGPAQIEASRHYWGVETFDLLQVHNLLAWEDHLRTLFAMKQAGQLRHVGITTSEGRRHDEFERIMRTQPLDCVQLTYNVVDREAESRILPLAQERGMAVIINRPFREGALTKKLQGAALPGFAAEIGCTSWAQILLKFIVAHPAVTCAIPATTRVDHVTENLRAAADPLPDAAMRARIVAAVEKI
jgi:diketogulonate reductase-like aldo/keto reductase